MLRIDSFWVSARGEPVEPWTESTRKSKAVRGELVEPCTAQSVPSAKRPGAFLLLVQEKDHQREGYPGDCALRAPALRVRACRRACPRGAEACWPRMLAEIAVTERNATAHDKIRRPRVRIQSKLGHMDITYRMVVDPAYCHAIIARYYRQRHFLLWLPVQFALPLVPLVGVWIYGQQINASWSTTVGMLLLVWPVVAIACVYVIKWGILQRLRSKDDFGNEVTMVVSEDGISAHGQHVQGKWAWAAYPRSVRFPDGILLLRRGAIRWLPDSAIQTGDAKEATNLVGSNTVLRHIA